MEGSVSTNVPAWQVLHGVQLDELLPFAYEPDAQPVQAQSLVEVPSVSTNEPAWQVLHEVQLGASSVVLNDPGAQGAQVEANRDVPGGHGTLGTPASASASASAPAPAPASRSVGVLPPSDVTIGPDDGTSPAASTGASFRPPDTSVEQALRTIAAAGTMHAPRRRMLFTRVGGVRLSNERTQIPWS